jgi:hypothetical protein
MTATAQPKNFDWTVFVRPLEDGRHFELLAISERPYGTRVWVDRMERFIEPQHKMEQGAQLLRLMQESIEKGYKLVHGEWSTAAVRMFADGIRYNDERRITGESQTLQFEINRSLKRTPAAAPAMRPGMGM